MPQNSTGVKINCSSDAFLHSVMYFAVVEAKDEIGVFYDYVQGKTKNSPFYKGSYREKVMDYDVTLTGMQPGKTYYFCAYKGSGFLGKGQYQLELLVYDF